MKKILFGGSFDPIHNGHLNMAEEAHRSLGADVIFIPAKIAVWKDNSISIEHKINMLKLAIEGKAYFFIDLFEIENEKEINYTIDTVEHYVNTCQNDEFYLLIGTDQVNSFHKWKDAEKLSRLVKIIFFERPNYIVDENNVKKYRMLSIPSEKLVDVSSSDIRSLHNLGLPLSVLKYIEDHRLYFFETLGQYLDEKRLNHSISVANLAFDIALKHQLKNSESAYIAGLLHDLGKANRSSVEIMQKYYPEYLDLPYFAYHQFVGAYLASTVFEIEDKNILEAIKFHATGNEKMGEIAMIVYAADKIEPTREYDSSTLIEAMYKNDIVDGFKVVLKANIEFLSEMNKAIDNRLTYNCCKYYL